MDVQQQIATAEALHQAGQLQQAALAYQRILMTHPAATDASYGLGTVLLQLSEIDGALQWLARALQQAPDDPQIRLNYALALEADRQSEAATTEVERAAVLARGDRVLLLPICRKLLSLDRPQQAYRLLLEVASADPQWVTLTARAQGECGDWAGALARLDGLVQAQPDEPECWRQLSQAAARLRDFEGARSAFEHYLSMKIPTAEDMLALADLELLAHRPEYAQRAVTRARALGGDSAALHLLLAKCQRLAGRYEAAREQLLVTLVQHPAAGEAWQMLLETEPSADLPAFVQRAEQVLEQRLGRPRDRILLALTAGRAREKLADYRRAFAHFKHANEQHTALLTSRGLPYSPQQSAAIFRRIIELFPRDPCPVNRSDPYPGSAAAPIFILGMPRSGTTLVERMLSALEGVVAGGENEAMEFLAADYYWQLEQAELPPPSELSAQQWREFGARYWQRSGRGEVDSTDALTTHVTDKMPHNTRHVGLILSMFPAAPVLYLRRDPRDVCLSIYCHMFPHGHGYACDLGHLAHFYAQTRRIMQHWKTIFPGRILDVSYEDLVAQPTENTRKIAAFCGLKWQADCLQFHQQTSASFTFSEVQVREPLNSAGIGRWRHYRTELAGLSRLLEAAGVL